MLIRDEIKKLAEEYSAKLKDKMLHREKEMQSDDTAHYLIYRVLGIAHQEGQKIDLYQNKGRFLYKYAGTFLEKATKLCFELKWPDSGSMKIPNPNGKRPRSFEIDCVVDKIAIEIKWRDATTDGDHITKEHSRIQAVKSAGYIPVRIMYYYPNRQQAIKIQETLRTLYKGVHGEYYVGTEAWEYVKNQTGVDLCTLLMELADEKTR